jgi:TM2 domain-containing membrane protein YozV
MWFILAKIKLLSGSGNNKFVRIFISWKRALNFSQAIPVMDTHTARNRPAALCLAIFLGPLGLHRLYLRSWWGVAYLPVLYAGIVLTASAFIAIKIFGYGLLVMLSVLYVTDIYRIVKGDLKDGKSVQFSVAGFIVVGLISALSALIAIGILIVAFRIVSFSVG